MSRGSNFWFHSAKPVKFIMVDYRVSIFLILFLLHMRMWTFGVLILFVLIFYILETQKINIVNAFKKLRFKMAGNTRRIK